MLDAEVAVLGSGVMGAAAAWTLARRGRQVAVMEQFGPANRWGASHGRARIFRLAYPDPLYVRLAQAALPGWRELERGSGVDVLTLTGAVDRGDGATLAALAAALGAADEPVETLTAEQAHQRWPGLLFDGDVLYHARAGRLDAEAPRPPCRRSSPPRVPPAPGCSAARGWCGSRCAGRTTSACTPRPAPSGPVTSWWPPEPGRRICWPG
jgi:glycine/D-amino acid oxidase-like deaminating enzyme